MRSTRDQSQQSTRSEVLVLRVPSYSAHWKTQHEREREKEKEEEAGLDDTSNIYFMFAMILLPLKKKEP